MQDFTQNSFEYVKVNGKIVTLTKLHQRVRPDECTHEEYADALRPLFKEHKVRAQIGEHTLIVNGEGKQALLDSKTLALL